MDTTENNVIPIQSQTQELMTAEEVARLCRTTRQSITAWAKSGRIPSRRLGHRWLFYRHEIEAVLERKTA